jgi:hypothetical protein
MIPDKFGQMIEIVSAEKKRFDAIFSPIGLQCMFPGIK